MPVSGMRAVADMVEGGVAAERLCCTLRSVVERLARTTAIFNPFSEAVDNTEDHWR